MSVRVAVASRDGLMVHQHFGRATHFRVYELDGKTCRLVDVRENTPSCGDDLSENPHENVIRLLADCRAVLVSRIGPCASEQVRSRGIEPFMVSGFIDEAIRELAASGILSFSEHTEDSYDREKA